VPWTQRYLALLLSCLSLQVQTLVLRDHVHVGGSGHKSSESCSKLVNAGTHYTVKVAVGTPPQQMDLIADTGNSFPVIVQQCSCRDSKDYFVECKTTEKCFAGSNSSSYVAPSPFAPHLGLGFGVGSIVATAATDVVRVGRVSAEMKKGLLLIVRRAFTTTYDFEGILGLGVPAWSQEKQANRSDPDLKKAPIGSSVQLPSFLEVAKVNTFSMCFTIGQGGALRLNPDTMPRMLQQVGKNNWALSLMGFSAGSSSASISVCNPDSKASGAVSACAAIPDSGTTHILGPAKDVERIKADLCTQWPRCAEFKEQGSDNASMAFTRLLWDCRSWMTEGKGISEVPSLFVHAQGGDGEKEVLEITAMSYVYDTFLEWAPDQPHCEAGFDTYAFNTMKHGAAWILGTSLFYEYQVAYKLRPPSIGFSKSACKLCGGEAAALISTMHLPRRINGKPRLPSIDKNGEL
jgi:hypothetical protein